MLRHMPYPVFDDVIHEPHRLRICAMLVPVDRHRLRHGARRDGPVRLGAVQAPQGPVGAAATPASTASVRDGRQVTTVVLTPAGREALCGHVAELQRMARIVGSDRRSDELRSPLTRPTHAEPAVPTHLVDRGRRDLESVGIASTALQAACSSTTGRSRPTGRSSPAGHGRSGRER